MRNAINSIAACAIKSPAKALIGFMICAQALATTLPEVQADIAQARLGGEGKLRVLGFEVYDARLWVGPDFNAERFVQHDFALEIAYLRNFDNVDIAKRSVKEMRRVAVVSDAQAQQWLQTMTEVFPDVKKGDRLTGIHRADGSARFLFNGKPLAQIDDKEFAPAFFAIWLSPKTSQPRLRERLFSLLAKPEAAK
jgi:Chalcone isomerase-like